jgi:anti-sigma factor (TIGR02949 family)
MTDCNETLRELETFLDGELSERTKAAIRAHLDGCSDCLQIVDFHAELRAVISLRCRSDELPPGLLERIARCFETDADAR